MRQKVRVSKNEQVVNDKEVKKVKVKAPARAQNKEKIKCLIRPRRHCRGPVAKTIEEKVIDLVSSDDDEENKNSGDETDTDSIKLIKIGRKIQSSSQLSLSPTISPFKLSTTGNQINNVENPSEKRRKRNAVKRRIQFTSPSLLDSRSNHLSPIEVSLAGSSTANSSFSGSGIEAELYANQINNGNENPVKKRRVLPVKRKIQFGSPGLKTLDSESTYLSVLEASLSGSSTANSSFSGNELELLGTSVRSDIIEIEVTSHEEIPSPFKPNSGDQVSQELADDFQDQSISITSTTDESITGKNIHQYAEESDIIEISVNSFDVSSSSSISIINCPPYAPAHKVRQYLSVDSSCTSNFEEEIETSASTSRSILTSTPTPSCSTSFQAKDFISLTDSDDYESAKNSENGSFTSAEPNTDVEVGEGSTGTGEKEPDLNLDHFNQSSESERLSDSQEFEMIEEVILDDILKNYALNDETENKLLQGSGLFDLDWDGLRLRLDTITCKELDSILKTCEMETGTDGGKEVE